jgi:hypothetical protein
VSKDRAAPFSRKHRRYWIPVTGGMILIGLVNLGIGFWSYEAPSTKTEKMELELPTIYRDAGASDAPIDAAPDATPSN